jgi:hypothetical protein
MDLENLNTAPRDFNEFELDTDSFDIDVSPVSSGDPNELSVAFVKRKLPDYLDMNAIEGVVTDQSVTPGAEVVTIPLDYGDTLQIIDIMADFISKYGYTSDRTGLHMNVSLPRGMSIDHIDPLVLLLLLDNKYIDDQFLPRQYVNTMMNYFRNNEDNAAYDLLTNGAQSLINLTRAYIPTKVKYQQINFSHLGFKSTSSSRIEYRSPGGDYINDTDLLKKELTRLLYMLNATINHNRFYPRDRMLKDVIRLWDRVSMESSGRTFNEVIDQIRRKQERTSKKFNAILDDPRLNDFM